MAVGVGAGEALAIWSELAIKDSPVALTFNLQGHEHRSLRLKRAAT